MHAIDVDNGGTRHALVLRRRARRDLPPDVGVVDNEAAALSLLAGSDLRAPRLVAADPAAAECDVPALLMTRVAGRDDISPTRLDRWLDGLAATLAALRRVEVPPGVLGYYRPWGWDEVTAPPSWSSRPEAWKRAIEIVHTGVPPTELVLCHRDFHPGNVLWSRGKVSGVVDWTHACRGAPAADVAHCRLNLITLFDLATADAFTARCDPVDHLPWFDLADVVSLGDSSPEVWRFHDAGRTDLTAQSLVDAADAFVVQGVERYDGV
jgi:aminoglycoside phosphotransferase (APT) family kinase protein